MSKCKQISPEEAVEIIQRFVEEDDSVDDLDNLLGDDEIDLEVEQIIGKIFCFSSFTVHDLYIVYTNHYLFVLAFYLFYLLQLL